MSSMWEGADSRESESSERLKTEARPSLSHFNMTISGIKYRVVKLKKWLLGRFVNSNNYKTFKFILSDNDMERYEIENAIAFSEMTSMFRVGDVVKVISETKYKNSVFTIDRITYRIIKNLKRDSDGKTEIVIKVKLLFYCGNNPYDEKQITHHRMGKRKKLTI